MNTELIKKLRDAGFVSEKEDITLSDLLGALNFPIKLMVNMKQGCSAQIWNKGYDNMDWYPTPEEAVAYLWLEIDGIKKWNEEQLNKK